MKWSVFSLLISAQLLSQKILWDEYRRLTWNDFKSPVSRKYNKNVIAYTHCGWEYSFVKSSDPKAAIHIEVKTFFDEDKSWKDARRINEDVLLHEQKHFDIAEMYARQLRREIAEKIKTSKDYDQYFKSIYQRISSEYRAFQMEYDRNTEHGMNREKQSQYNIVITEDLDRLKSYKTF